MMLPIIMILLCAITGAVAFFYLKKTHKPSKDQLNESQKTAQELVNVKDTEFVKKDVVFS